MSYCLRNKEYKFFNDLVDDCTLFYKKNRQEFITESVIERRNQLSYLIEELHSEAGTLSSRIKEKVSLLKDQSSIFLMTAHQPNLFPYSGVFRKASLLSALEKELESRIGVPVVSFFGIADQDFTDDRWVRSTILPSIKNKEGKLVLNINLPSNIVLNNVPKPSRKVMVKWKADLETWLNESNREIKSYLGKNKLSNWKHIEDIIYDNFNTFWRIVEESYSQSSKYSDFNSYILSKIINVFWESDILFARFSDIQPLFIKELEYIISSIGDYTSSLKEASKYFCEDEKRYGVSRNEIGYLPFWYHCNCGSKAKLSYVVNDSNITGYGTCITCKNKYDFDIGNINKPNVNEIKKDISFRAIPNILILSKGLGPICYVGGLAGKEYLDEVKFISKKINIVLPKIAIWRPYDVYIGLNKLEAISYYYKITGNYEISEWYDEYQILKNSIDIINKKINEHVNKKEKLIKILRDNDCDKETILEKIKNINRAINKIKKDSNISLLKRNLVILSNYEKFINIIPSIIDYIINVGIKDVDQQYNNFLINGQDLNSNVHLRSIYDDYDDIKEMNVIKNIEKMIINS